METPEIHKPHRARHGGGLPQWLELVIAISALVTSISSIAIALHHGQIMQKLVQANSIPYLEGGFSDVTPEGKEVISLDLLNRGVGPAHEKSLHVRVGDRYVHSLDELIAASLGPEAAKARATLGLMYNRVPTRFVPAGQSRLVFRIPKTAENARFWELLANDEARWEVEFCYCSVFDECWQVRGKMLEPGHVKQCLRDPQREFIP